jgi:hypothetical protein
MAAGRLPLDSPIIAELMLLLPCVTDGQKMCRYPLLVGNISGNLAIVLISVQVTGPASFSAL